MPGRVGEMRRANAEDSAMDFDGMVRGNALINNAARMPSINPKSIRRAFGRMTRPRPENTPAAARVGGERRAGIVGTRVAIESTM
jgi:hypothetical protein